LILNESVLTFYPASTPATASIDSAPIKCAWVTIAKHQVSPASHPRHLLKVVLHIPDDPTSTSTSNGNKSAPQTYEFKSRSELERIRKDLSARLVHSRRVQAQNADPLNGQANGNRKRKLDESGMSPKSSQAADEETSSSTFTSLTQSENSVTRSSILASDKNLHTQHSLLTTAAAAAAAAAANNTTENNATTQAQEPTVYDEDFWSTHSRKVSNQSAKIHGFVSKGLSSAMKSSLDIQITGNISKPIKLGVEEMRQIFIMYPAVHDTYEEKVPLELSEEQFWRKYLESEYFHRDRGRLGSSARSVSKEKDSTAQGEDEKGKDSSDNKKIQEEENKAAKEREETARMGAASSNDIFSRKEIELQRNAQNNNDPHSWKNLAVGQFDLTSTANTERGSKLLLNSNDFHPFDDRGRKVIEKYNRHWAMVLNPEDATAGCDLTTLARGSAKHSLEDDDDAKVSGGVGEEMRRLVGYANADEDNVDHVKGMGRSNNSDDSEPVLFEELKLKNVDAYAGKRLGSTNTDENISAETDTQNAMFAQFAMDQVKAMVKPLIDYKQSGDRNDSTDSSVHRIDNAFPDPTFGHILLLALTDHMVRDSRTDKDTAKMTKALPLEFRNRLTSYTRRSSELLRHFFALRHVMENEKKIKTVGSKSSQKLKKIVMGMEGVYREMEGTRKGLPQTELGEQMRKMCLPIMDQLDWAFKLNRDSSGSGGGFVTVKD